ncbi:MAG: SH3 domain-containing protein, partial [Chloroflexota bacterium]|nr:SH3 domain-containing protein [Chloroflexota bacterium]
QLAAAETPAAPTATFASGTIVIVNENGVRLRSSPSTTSDVVAELDQGRELTVTGPPEEGDGIVWYPVQANDDEAVTGYIAEEFVATADG